METCPEHVQARLTPEQMARIRELAARDYDRNMSMATRHIIAEGLRVLGLAESCQQQKVAG